MGLFKWLKKKQKEAEGANFSDKPMGYLHSDPTNIPDPALQVKKAWDREEQWPDNEASGRFAGVKDFDKPKYKVKAILTGTTLTAFLPNGAGIVITNQGDHEMLQSVIGAGSEAEVRAIMLDEEDLPEEAVAELRDRAFDEEILAALPEIVGTGEFETKGGALYMKGIDLSIPRLLARQILEAGKRETSEYYDALKNFWCWCAANPDPTAREDLFDFLERGDFKITKRGFFLGFRNVAQVKGGKEANRKLVEFISAKYVNIKTKQKKSPKNFVVIKNAGEYEVVKHDLIPSLDRKIDVVGNLADLYNNLASLEDNVYTDEWTHKMTIKIGQPVKMDRSDCNSDPKEGCSRGLHIKNKRYGNGHGSVSLVCIVNPMNVVAVPKYEHNKLRTCEYFPLGVVEGPWEKWLEDADTLQLEDEYVSMEVKNIMNIAQEAKEGKVKAFIGERKTLIQQVANKIGEYQDELKNRVVKV